MARSFWLYSLLALPLLLASCLAVDSEDNTDASVSGSTVNAMQLVDGTTLEYSSSSVLVKGCGIEHHILYDAKGLAQGIARIANSRNYLSVELSPAPPWLALEAEAKYWTNIPSEGEPPLYSASRQESEGVATLVLWLPLAEELIGVANAGVYVSGELLSVQDASYSSLYLMDEAPDVGDAFYVNFHTCIYPPLADPDPALFSSSSSVEALSSAYSSTSLETGVSSAEAGSSSSEVGSSSAEAGSSSAEAGRSSLINSSSSSQPCPSSSAGISQGGHSSMVAPSSSACTPMSSSNPSSSSWNLCGKEADGRTIGFWKNNLSKYMDGARKGMQVSAAEMESYLKELGIGAAEALAILSSHGSDPSALLAKQLMASRFNLLRGAYIDGDESYTRDFIGWGLDLLEKSDATAQELLDAKDLFDAYNNSHGGAIGMHCSL